jgi:cation:H+ antiporter
MRILIDVFLLILGFVLLVKSAEIFVNASVEIAKRLKIPNMVIALTVVAMGTSAPELVISVSAAIGGSGDLAVANVVGSNIFNLMFIVGFCALLFPIDVKLRVISRDYWVSVAATVFLLVIVIVFNDTMPRFASLILLLGFVTYMVVVVRHALKNKIDEDNTDKNAIKPKPLAQSIIFAVLGAAIIIGGGQLTVSSAVNIALTLGITERVIGLTIVAMGTSLPELVTTLIACRKKEGEFALGFIIGSSIFNIMFVLGLAGLITPLTIESGVVFDLMILTAGTLTFFLFAYSSRRVVRVEGFTMVMIYAAYMVFVLLLQTGNWRDLLSWL